MVINAGPYREEGEAVLQQARDERWVERLWARDTGLWSDDPATQKQIGERLGWLDLARWGSARVDELQQYADEVAARGINHCVWLGMGGASLAARAIAQLPSASSPRLRLSVCDDNHPRAVAALGATLELERTLFIVASKSGATLETDCLLRHFHHAVERAGIAPGPLFAAVTDPGSALDDEARRRGFHRVFHNPPDVGGRYGALSYTGLLAAALCGHSPRRLIEGAAAAMEECRAADDAGGNPWLRVAVTLAAGARHGCDKIVLQLPPSLRALTPWIEQLVAESTGKDRRGLTPIPGDDEIALPEDAIAGGYCRVTIVDEGGDGFATRDSFPAVAWRGGTPGAEFFRWQFITAIAGAVLRVNPFDEPAVAYNKTLTRELLAAPAAPQQPLCRSGGISCFGERPGNGARPGNTLDEILRDWLGGLEPGHYLALLSHLAPGALPPDTPRRLQHLAARRGCLGTTCQGPGYLHSSGQLHKDGPQRARFLLLSDRPEYESETETPIPGRDFGFGALHQAQALADVIALQKRGRAVLHLRLETDDAAAQLDAALTRLEAAAAAP